MMSGLVKRGGAGAGGREVIRTALCQMQGSCLILVSGLPFVVFDSDEILLDGC